MLTYCPSEPFSPNIALPPGGYIRTFESPFQALQYVMSDARKADLAAYGSMGVRFDVPKNPPSKRG